MGRPRNDARVVPRDDASGACRAYGADRGRRAQGPGVAGLGSTSCPTVGGPVGDLGARAGAGGRASISAALPPAARTPLSTASPHASPRSWSRWAEDAAMRRSPQSYSSPKAPSRHTSPAPWPRPEHEIASPWSSSPTRAAWCNRRPNWVDRQEDHRPARVRQPRRCGQRLRRTQGPNHRGGGEPAAPRGRTLDALQQALWAKAMEGDLPAVAGIVRIIQARCRLYGVTGRGPNPLPPTTPRTVVLSPEEPS